MKIEQIAEAKIYIGDCLESLKTMPDKSVNCCITSPPYYGLRDYGTAAWEGGDPKCDHVIEKMRRGLGLAESEKSTRGGGHKITECENIKAKSVCPKCGAICIDKQIGLEETLQEYIDKLIFVFREVRRVLRDDGTLWLNLGDSYVSVGSGIQGEGEMLTRRIAAVRNNKTVHDIVRSSLGLSPKNLIGIPWRVAFALQAEGWYLRQDIIWAKPNPLPESVTDRCTKAHEYIFLLAKSKKYYFDNEAIKQPQTASSRERAKYGWRGRIDDNSGGAWTGSSFKRMAETGEPIATIPEDGMRNRRSVWIVPTTPYKEAHFAAFPPDLIEPCILAGSPKNGIVLDPFAGSGTTAQVALRHGRKAILCELNSEYVKLIKKRLTENDECMTRELAF